MIYDYIDPFGVSAQEFADEIKSLDVDQLDVRINSPGGSAFDGIAIFNALKRHPANVTTYNDGLAASAASFIAQAGDKRVTSKYAETMVHGPSAISIGNADDMRAVAEQLDKLGGNMAQLYADAAGGSVKSWMAVMDAETWYTGAEAVKAGLFDEVAEDSNADASSTKASVESAAAAFDYSQFRYAGRSAAPAPFAKRGEPMADKITGLASATAASLGPDPDDDPNELLASLDATLDEAAKLAGPVDRASVPPEVGQVLDLVVAAEALVDQLMDLVGVYDPDDDDGDNPTASAAGSPLTTATAKTEGQPNMTAEGKPAGQQLDPDKITKGSAPNASSAPPETVTVDAEAFKVLQEQARRGAEAHAAMQASSDAAVVDEAIEKGKITPGRREHFMAMMSADREATTKLLNETLQEAAIPLTEMGHASALDDGGPQAKLDTENPLYTGWMAS